MNRKLCQITTSHGRSRVGLKMGMSSNSKLEVWLSLGFAFAMFSCLGTVSDAEDRHSELSCGGTQVASPFTQEPQNAGTDAAEAHAPPNAIRHGIRLQWKPSPSPNATVAGYNIFRRESGPDCQQKVNSCQQINQAIISATTCVDYSAQPGRTYIYQAQTVSHSGLRSAMSNEAKATLP